MLSHNVMLDWALGNDMCRTSALKEYYNLEPARRMSHWPHNTDFYGFYPHA